MRILQVAFLHLYNYLDSLPKLYLFYFSYEYNKLFLEQL